MHLKKFAERFYLKRSIKHLMSVVKILFTDLLIAHWIACIWMFIYKLEKEQSSSRITWLDKFTLDNNIQIDHWSQ